MLHFAEAAVDLFKALANEAERFAEAGFERGLEFFVDGRAHFLEATGTVYLQGRQTGIQRFPNAIEVGALGVSGF
jgi:hypothetical protein